MTPWSLRLLHFPDRAAFLAAMAASGWPDLGSVPAEAASLLELGAPRGPSIGTGDAEVPGPLLPAWRVQALFAGAPPAALASAEVAEVAGAPVVPSAEAPAASPSVHEIPALRFLERFTAEERYTLARVAEQAAQAGDVTLWDRLDRTRAAQTINLLDPEVIGAVHDMEAGGLLASGRAAEILEPQA